MPIMLDFPIYIARLNMFFDVFPHLWEIVYPRDSLDRLVDSLVSVNFRFVISSIQSFSTFRRNIDQSLKGKKSVFFVKSIVISDIFNDILGDFVLLKRLFDFFLEILVFDSQRG